MTEEPYRWLEAVANRREYVREQLKGGSPVLAASLPEGILLLGVGGGQSKVFELFDRHALAGLGHPADIERIRQAAIEDEFRANFQRAFFGRVVARGIGAGSRARFVFPPAFRRVLPDAVRRHGGGGLGRRGRSRRAEMAG